MAIGDRVRFFECTQEEYDDILTAQKQDSHIYNFRH